MKGILTEQKQERAREMLKEIGAKQKETDKKEPHIMTMEREMLKNLWTVRRKFTFAEFDLINQVHGRIKQ
jgi:hypothetical protein